jgi:Domain of unknown function (DUF4160)
MLQRFARLTQKWNPTQTGSKSWKIDKRKGEPAAGIASAIRILRFPEFDNPIDPLHRCLAACRMQAVAEFDHDLDALFGRHAHVCTSIGGIVFAETGKHSDRFVHAQIILRISVAAEPPHVHVARDALRAKFWLEPLEVVRAGEFNARELRVIQAILEDNREALLETWNGYFGSGGR